MAAWQRSIRVVLVLCVLGVGAAVLFGIRDRTEPARAIVVERSDPDAVIETRGSRIVQADSVGENLRVVADRQDTYRDGALRLVDNVQVTVVDRDDRPGFVLTGDEAHVDAGKTEVRLTGRVAMTSSDGLSATTDEASYADGRGIVRMPGPTAFTREGMDASGGRAEYDRTRDVLRLLASARVDLVGDDSRTQIRSRAATLAQGDDTMTFRDNVNIETGTRRMTATNARVLLRADGATPERLELAGAARVLGATADDDGNGLRELSADDMSLAYTDDGVGIESAVLAGRARLETASTDGASTEITGDAMDLLFDPVARSVRRVTVRDQVTLKLPATADGPAQTVTADVLTMTNTSGQGLDSARFEGNVELAEVIRGDTGADIVRTTRSQRLDATLAPGLAELTHARFLGDVMFEEQDVLAVADEAIYLLAEGRVELITSGPAGRAPRFEDPRGSVQARAIELALGGDQVHATDEVESVLTTEPSAASGAPASRRPGMLEPDEPAYVTAGHFEYTGETQTAIYTQDARLWQGDTEFRGDRLVLDEATGNITAEGDVRTRSVISQIDDETGQLAASVTTGRGRQFVFDDTAHRATYTTEAHVTGPRGDLTADLIHLIMQPDSRTLGRIEAMGDVRLVTSERRITGAALVFHDAEGRYEMEGEPVRIVEEFDAECRETTGRRLTFYLTDDAVSVDGESEVRTETLRGTCPELTP